MNCLFGTSGYDSFRPAEPVVLVVDDDGCCRSQLRAFVEGEGHACVAIGSGTEALTWCVGARPDVVLTDLEMPGIDGCALARDVRIRYPDVPLALVTGRDLSGGHFVDLASLFDAVLTKPIDLDLLSELLTNWLGTM